ncbi:MAG: hypothetical protein M9890_13850 [Thermomicrobiales bacterium]|nr:hypothetical protein [Thermomicrobiales bacterium]
MSAILLRSLLKRFDEVSYINPDGSPIKMVVSLDNGVVLRGHVISAEEWLSLNTRGGDASRDEEAQGSWPEGVAFSPDDDRYCMMYMSHVEYLSGGQWVAGSTIHFSSGKAIALGDQY